MADLIIGIETYFFNIVLSIIFIIYIYLFYPIVKRSFRDNNKNKYNSLIVLIILFILSIAVIMPGAATEYYLYMPLNYYILVFFGFWTLMNIFTVSFQKTDPFAISEIEVNKNLATGLESEDRDKQEVLNFSLSKESKRKILHLLAILYIACWVVQPIVFVSVNSYAYPAVQNGVSTEQFNNIGLYGSLDITIEAFLQNGVVLQFFVLICCIYASADAELLRLRFPEYNFLLKRTLQSTRRATEVSDISSHLHLMIGLAISTLMLTFTSTDRIAGCWAQMGIVCIATFGDLSAALIGRKFGKHKWKIHKGKSLEGSAAGCLVAFFTAMIFVGPVLALIGALTFWFTDIILSKLAISDNIANPILLAIIFKLLIFLVNPMVATLPYPNYW